MHTSTRAHMLGAVLPGWGSHVEWSDLHHFTFSYSGDDT